MKYLFDEWNNLKEKLEQSRIFLFLDYDGTLTSIVDTPEQAILPKNTKEILKALSENNQCRVAIISGRALDDIKARVSLDGLVYVGNHGLEIYDSKLCFRWMMPPHFKETLTEIKNRLKEVFAKIEGVFIEDKEFTLSLHYRMAHVEDAVIKSMFDKVLSPYQSKGEIAIVAGKKVFEIRPPKIGRKGKIAANLLVRERLAANYANILPIYIGDDETDEDAFKEMVHRKGVAIRVGEDNTSLAHYYLNDTEEVTKLLEMILELKKGA
jgi:alpha,alpha-trehalase